MVEAFASALAGIPWGMQIIEPLPKTCPQKLCGWSPAICVFKKPSRQFLHTLKFENYCSINAGYFQTNFLIFLYFNVKYCPSMDREVFSKLSEKRNEAGILRIYIHTRLKAVILNPSGILEWLRKAWKMPGPHSKPNETDW